jgi:hypothetical protein
MRSQTTGATGESGGSQSSAADYLKRKKD